MFISWFNGTHIFLIISGKNCLTPNFNAPKYLQGTHFPENPHWKKCATFKNTTVYDGCPVKKYMVFDQMSSTFIDQMSSTFIDAGTPAQKINIYKRHQNYCFRARSK